MILLRNVLTLNRRRKRMVILTLFTFAALC